VVIKNTILPDLADIIPLKMGYKNSFIFFETLKASQDHKPFIWGYSQRMSRSLPTDGKNFIPGVSFEKNQSLVRSDARKIIPFCRNKNEFDIRTLFSVDCPAEGKTFQEQIVRLIGVLASRKFLNSGIQIDSSGNLGVLSCQTGQAQSTQKHKKIENILFHNPILRFYGRNGQVFLQKKKMGLANSAITYYKLSMSYSSSLRISIENLTKWLSFSIIRSQEI